MIRGSIFQMYLDTFDQLGYPFPVILNGEHTIVRRWGDKPWNLVSSFCFDYLGPFFWIHHSDGFKIKLMRNILNIELKLNVDHFVFCYSLQRRANILLQIVEHNFNLLHNILLGMRFLTLYSNSLISFVKYPETQQERNITV